MLHDHGYLNDFRTALRSRKFNMAVIENFLFKVTS